LFDSKSNAAANAAKASNPATGFGFMITP